MAVVGLLNVAPVFRDPWEISANFFFHHTGDSINITCDAYGRPPPKIKWYKDDQLMRYTADGDPLSEHTMVLKFKDLKMKDQGYYKCFVWNRAGNISNTNQVELETMMITTPIPLPLENITVYDGDNATNTCKAMCDWPPWFEWYIYVGKGGNKQRKSFIPDLDNDEYLWIGDTGRYLGINFRIDNVTKEDERYYYCEIALDANGESYKESIFFYLHVLPKPVTTLPTTAIAKDCSEVQNNGKNESGVYQIDPDGQGSFHVYCDMTSYGGGWTVFQRRLDGSVDFYRGWNDYKQGFGNLSSEFWLGLDKIYRLTSAKRNKLRIDLEDTSGNQKYAEYDYFAVKNESFFFTLILGTYSGNSGNSLTPKHNYMKFTTKDADHDTCGGNCAVASNGAWWYNCCYDSNLNGYYYHGFHKGYKGVVWRSWKGMKYSLKSTEMKIKP
ncbi:tenascin-R-like [Xenia sp. Carnegie-2017]|uniref:tenascin-R-like n=1 Tax=Xenia sp. Carnegie-2017 TaxID=2897299 RepID=UPI001F03AAF0|nr:tenascin-R-like [Xenia sp. Carnegie-2017]